MIDKLKKLIYIFRYAGMTREEMDMCTPTVRKMNSETLNWLIILMLGVLLTLLGISCIPGSPEEVNKTAYMIYTIIIGCEYLLYRFFFRKHEDLVLVMSYIFVITEYMIAIVMACMIGTESTGTPFCVFLVTVPLMVTDRPSRLTVLTIIMECVLLSTYTKYAGPNIGDRFVVVNSISCMILGIFSGFVIQKTKFSDIRNGMLLQIQRDTDILTGAYTRVAYVRDLERMSTRLDQGGVVYCDVNGLKEANDKNGHEAGDVLIREAYQIMKKYFDHVGDRIYRIGGDEFIIIRIGGTQEDFNKSFENMTEKDERHEILSCGAVWKNLINAPEEAIKEAEAKMYAHKQNYYDSHPEKDRRTR